MKKLNPTNYCARTIFLILSLLTSHAYGSVTILGSRIIYPEKSGSVDVLLKNNDDIPYVIQTWFDDGDTDSQPQKQNNAIFISSPPVFRIQPRSGQIIRVIFSSSRKLATDRETLGWFNMLQIPPSNLDDSKNKNAMLVIVRNRIKTFYRPAAIGNPGNILKNLKLTYVYDLKKGGGVEIENPQPWHASIVDIKANINSGTYKSDAEMIPPFSKKTFWFNSSKLRPNDSGEVIVAAINDQGARLSERYNINHK